MGFTKEEVQEYMDNTLKPDDTFTFQCQACGACCRKRATPILMTGMDVFRVAQALNMKPMDVTSKYMRTYLGDDSHIPLFVLKERDDGSCSLLRKGKCSVHSKKPVVCAIYPLGRYLNYEDKSIQYFRQDNVCKAAEKGGKVWTLNEWLDAFGIRELDNMSRTWYSLMSGIARVMCKMEPNKVDPMMYALLAQILYWNYDISKKYEDEVALNMEYAKVVFNRLYKIDFEF